MPLVHKHIALCRIGGDDRTYRLTNAVFSIDFNLFPLACSPRGTTSVAEVSVGSLLLLSPIDHT